MISPSEQEQKRRDEVIATILQATKDGVTIRLPDFDRTLSRPSDNYALVSVGIEPNPYGGTVGDYRYQFEGEEDLLHLIITRNDCEVLTPEQAQQVVSFLYPGVPTALMWLRPAHYSQHFYLGHDVLLDYL
ncbi:MAG: hypothetical protein MUC92_08680 [Fimbriimonadaceae bacterium]|nr:hypothetical protein [Fimbriimonadaceae bacterium]